MLVGFYQSLRWTSSIFSFKVKDDVDREMMKMMRDMDNYQKLVEKRVQEVREEPSLHVQPYIPLKIK